MARDFRGNSVDLKGGGGGSLNKSREGSCLKKNHFKVPRCWFERFCLMFIPYLGKFDPKFYWSEFFSCFKKEEYDDITIQIWIRIFLEGFPSCPDYCNPRTNYIDWTISPDKNQWPINVRWMFWFLGNKLSSYYIILPLTTGSMDWIKIKKKNIVCYGLNHAVTCHM